MREFDLDAVRTDGWFERIGEGIGSLPGALRDHRRALLRVLDHRRRAHHGAHGGPPQPGPLARRLRRRRRRGATTASSRSASRWPTSAGAWSGALLVEDDKPAPEPTRETEIEVIQLYIGVRYLLLAPLYGYSLRKLDPRRGGGRPARRPARRRRGDARSRRLPLPHPRARPRGARAGGDRIAQRHRPLEGDRGRGGGAQQGVDARSCSCSAAGRRRSPSSCARPRASCSTSDARGLIAKGLGPARAARACTSARSSRPRRSSASASSTRRRVWPRPTSSAASARRSCRTSVPARPSGRCAARSPSAAAPADVMPPLARAFIKRKKWVAALRLPPRRARGRRRRARAGRRAAPGREAPRASALTGWKAKLVESKTS